MCGKKLNKVMQLIEPSGVTVLVGAPASGKTALAINLAMQCGIYEGGSVAIFSAEMLSEHIVQRMISLDSGVELKKIIEEKCSQNDQKDILLTTEKIAKGNIFIDDEYCPTAQYIVEQVEKLAEKKVGIDFVIVDYLQLLGATTTQSSCYDEDRSILNELEGIAKQYRVPILVLAHLIRSDWDHGQSFNEITADDTIGYINFNCDWLLLKLDKELEYSELSVVRGERKGEVIPLKFDRKTLRFDEQ